MGREGSPIGEPKKEENSPIGELHHEQGRALRAVNVIKHLQSDAGHALLLERQRLDQPDRRGRPLLQR